MSFRSTACFYGKVFMSVQTISITQEEGITRVKTKAGRRVSRLLLAVLAVVLMLGLCVVSFASVADGASAVATELQCYMPGDVNGDGTVNDRDAIYTLYHAIFEGEDKYAISHNWDFNGDNKEDSTDAIYLLYEVLFL